MKLYEHDGDGTIIFPDDTKHFVFDLDATSCPYIDGIDAVVKELNRLRKECLRLKERMLDPSLQLRDWTPEDYLNPPMSGGLT